MTRVYEYTTWMNSEEWKAKNAAAIAAGKAYKGTKFRLELELGVHGPSWFLPKTRKKQRLLHLKLFGRAAIKITIPARSTAETLQTARNITKPRATPRGGCCSYYESCRDADIFYAWR